MSNDEVLAIVNSDGVLEGPAPSVALEFVNVGAISKAEKVRNQKLIRSTAMKSFRRRQQSERSLKGAGSSKEAANTKSLRPMSANRSMSDEYVHSPPVLTTDFSCDVPFHQLSETSRLVSGSPQDRKNDHRGLVDSNRSESSSSQSSRSSSILDSPITLLGAGRIDPFQSLPVQSSPQINELIDHCENPNSPPLPSRLLLTSAF